MVFRVAHLTLAALWFGAMAYSLGVVQPKVARFFPDERRREEFLATLAQDNRWRVLALVGALLTTGAAGLVLGPPGAATGLAVVLALDAVATVIFVHVSWRHWPARVFALDGELAGFRRRLRLCAATMLLLVGSGFIIAVTMSLR